MFSYEGHTSNARGETRQTMKTYAESLGHLQPYVGKSLVEREEMHRGCAGPSLRFSTGHYNWT